MSIGDALPWTKDYLENVRNINVPPFLNAYTAYDMIVQCLMSPHKLHWVGQNFLVFVIFTKSCVG